VGAADPVGGERNPPPNPKSRRTRCAAVKADTCGESAEPVVATDASSRSGCARCAEPPRRPRCIAVADQEALRCSGLVGERDRAQTPVRQNFSQSRFARCAFTPLMYVCAPLSYQPPENQEPIQPQST
jgi:hypothetical protein